MPIANDIDQEARFPWEVVEKMRKLGYFGVQAPQKLGRVGMDSMSFTIVIEEISRLCLGLVLCLGVHYGVGVYQLMAFSSEEQKKRWLPPLAREEKTAAFCPISVRWG